MAALAGVFALTGPSLEIARAVSFLCVIVSFAVLVRILRARGLGRLAVCIAAAFFAGAHFVACGNVARMEALLLFMVLTAFKLLFDRRTTFALGILALGLLVHPNAAYFLGAALVYSAALLLNKQVRLAWTRTAAVATLALLVTFLSYSIYLAQHWPYVVEDWQFQLARKAERSVFAQIKTFDNLALFLLLVPTLLSRDPTARPRLALLVLAAPAWAAAVVGFEMWYRVFWVLAALIVTILFVESAATAAARGIRSPNPWVARGAVGLALVAAVAWFVARGYLETPIGYPLRMTFFELKTPENTTYWTAKDKAYVQEVIERESERRKIAVQFFPRAEALFHLTLRSERIRFVDPLFCDEKADLYIFHESRYLPPRWLGFLANDMTAAGLAQAERSRALDRIRDRTERWYVFRRSE
jgi:hypothetical protein